MALAAAAPALPGVGGTETRMTVDATALPWRALARLQVPGESRCTSVMVGPRTALTAAHCLTGPRTHRPVPPASVHVLIGYAGGQFARHSIATSYRLDGRGADVAVVTLADPIGADTLRLADADPPTGTAVVLGGYNRDRAEVIEADMSCRVIDATSARLVHDCAGTFGTSGAPLLGRAADGAWRIVGLQVAAFTDHIGGIAIPASRLRPALSAPAN